MACRDVVPAAVGGNGMEEIAAPCVWRESGEYGKRVFVGEGVLSRQLGDGGLQLFGVGRGLL